MRGGFCVGFWMLAYNDGSARMGAGVGKPTHARSPRPDNKGLLARQMTPLYSGLGRGDSAEIAVWHFQSSAGYDHFVGAGEQLRWYVEPQRLGGAKHRFATLVELSSENRCARL